MTVFWHIPRQCLCFVFRKTWANHHRYIIQFQKREVFHTSSVACKNKKSQEEVDIIKKDRIFEEAKEKECTKETFKHALNTYLVREKTRRGHVEFIYAALRRMKEFNVHKDLDVYKTILDIFPKGKYIPTNLFQVALMHYPKHQQCAVDLLDQMEDNGVCPDAEMYNIILSIFGDYSLPMKKFKRIMYWMPKFKNASPYLLPNPVPDDDLELAVLALKRMSVDLQTKVSIFHIKAEDELSKKMENSWVASAQSPEQQVLIAKHPMEKPIYVEGGFYIWLRNKTVIYFMLRTEPKPEHTEQNKIPDFDEEEDLDFQNWPTYFSDCKSSSLQEVPNIHQQEEDTILGLCVPKLPIKESLVAWLKFLQESNPELANIPVVFTLVSPAADLQVNKEESNMEVSDKT